MHATRTSPEVVTYLEGIDGARRALLERIRTIVREEAPDAEEVIAYGIPTFKLSGNLVHYAAFKNHLSFFPGGTTHNDVFRDELAGFRIARGTIQFTVDKPLPDDLVRRIVAMRVAENRNLVVSRQSARTKK